PLPGVRTLVLTDERLAPRVRGRPRNLYSLTAAGRELFPRRYDAILNAILAHITQDRGCEYAEDLLHGVANDTLKELKLKATGGRVPKNRLLAALNDLGFEATAQRKDSGRIITSRNCPIVRVAGAHRE